MNLNKLIKLKLKGKRGVRGKKGPFGYNGYKGFLGNTGNTGDIGAIGHIGPIGSIGLKGATGITGAIINGNSGATGPVGVGTLDNFRYFQISKNLTDNTKLFWQDYGFPSGNINANEWTLMCVGMNYNSTSGSVYNFSQLANLCYINLSDETWYFKHNMIDKNGITGGNMKFDILSIPKSITDDIRPINGILGYYKTIFSNISAITGDKKAPTSAFNPTTNGLSINTAKNTYNLNNGNFVPFLGENVFNYKQYYISFRIYWNNLTENILFRANADDAFSLRIRESGTGSWTTLFDYWGEAPSFSVGAATYRYSNSPYLMKSGKLYDVVIACGNFTGYTQTNVEYFKSPLNWSLAMYINNTLYESYDLQIYTNTPGIIKQIDSFVYQWDYYP